MQLEVLTTVALAMLLGGLVGLEREWAGKPAGLRTHMLVAGAAALFAGLADIIVHGVDLGTGIIRTDPVRIIEAIVTGVTFLGAGTIIRHRKEVEGLTTAASLLFVSALGIAASLHHYLLAGGATVLTLVVLRGVHALESRVPLWRAGRNGEDQAEP